MDLVFSAIGTPLLSKYLSKNLYDKNGRLPACSSTGNFTTRPMLVGAPRNALRAFNAGVSLFSMCVIACRKPYLQLRYKYLSLLQ
ncbi:MAG: hypothetical protein E7398_06365 [Ruminococcaceae bacterium]|nr:hypothetical protein [Oscillospiraceae bacterium]